MHGAAMLDFNLRLKEVPVSFRVGVLTSGSVPDDVSNCELRNSDFQDQIERTIIFYEWKLVKVGLALYKFQIGGFIFVWSNLYLK